MEFSDEQGRGYAVAPCPRADLLLLHYVPEAAAWRQSCQLLVGLRNKMHGHVEGE